MTPITHWQLTTIGTTISGDSLPLLWPSQAPDTKLVYKQAYRQTKHPHPYNEIIFFKSLDYSTGRDFPFYKNIYLYIREYTCARVGGVYVHMYVHVHGSQIST